MNKIYFSLILLLTISSGFAQTNEELQQMADADQEERFNGTDWKIRNKQLKFLHINKSIDYQLIKGV